MFNFLQPIWLFAAGAIAIPVAIHLWNVKQGKILKVGSIAFLKQSSKQYTSSLKLTELALLVIRCLLIILLALLLARPQWKQSFTSAGVKGWVLIEKENIAGAYASFKPLVDSLLQAGYEFHYFDEGFKKEELRQALNVKKDSAFKHPLSYRALVAQLDKLVPAALPVHIFTTNYLHKFNGARQPLSLNLHWHTYTPADSLAVFISKAYSISPDSIRVIFGHSQPAGTTHSYEDIDWVKNLNPHLHISREKQGLFISYQKDEPLAVDTTTLSITIFTGKYVTDAIYLQSAIEAIRKYSRRQISLSLASKSESIAPAQDWLFWLSASPVPATVKARNIFRYQDGPVKNTRSWINTNGGSNVGMEKPALYKLTANPGAPLHSRPAWQDGFGNTVLSLEENEFNDWRLFTRLDPSWNDLPWSNNFPQLIFDLLYPPDTKGITVPHDKRTIADQQILAPIAAKNIAPVNQKFITKDFSSICWLLAFIVFLIERFIALRKHREVANG